MKKELFLASLLTLQFDGSFAMGGKSAFAKTGGRSTQCTNIREITPVRLSVLPAKKVKIEAARIVAEKAEEKDKRAEAPTHVDQGLYGESEENAKEEIDEEIKRVDASTNVETLLARQPDNVAVNKQTTQPKTPSSVKKRRLSLLFIETPHVAPKDMDEFRLNDLPLGGTNKVVPSQGNGDMVRRYSAQQNTLVLNEEHPTADAVVEEVITGSESPVENPFECMDNSVFADAPDADYTWCATFNGTTTLMKNIIAGKMDTTETQCQLVLVDNRGVQRQVAFKDVAAMVCTPLVDEWESGGHTFSLSTFKRQQTFLLFGQHKEQDAKNRKKRVKEAAPETLENGIDMFLSLLLCSQYMGTNILSDNDFHDIIRSAYRIYSEATEGSNLRAAFCHALRNALTTFAQNNPPADALAIQIQNSLGINEVQYNEFCTTHELLFGRHPFAEFVAQQSTDLVQ